MKKTNAKNKEKVYGLFDFLTLGVEKDFLERYLGGK